RNHGWNDSGLCASAGGIRRHDHGRGQHSGPDFNFVSRHFSPRSTWPGLDRFPPSWSIGAAGVCGCLDQRMFDAAQKCHVSLLLKNIRLPLVPFTVEVDVEIRGRVTAIHGPSGAGKTTLLDVIAGLRRPESALIQLNDVVLTDTSTKTF